MKKIKKMFEKNDLIKITLIAVLITIALTWIIPATQVSSYSSTGYTEAEMGRLGIVDIALSGYYELNFFVQQIFVILAIGAFYGIVSKTSSYQAFISKLAKKFRNKTKMFVIGASLFITLLTTFTTHTLVPIVFIPFIASIASKLKLDKLTTFLSTFGALLVGVLGATYGTDSLVYFIQYLSTYSSTFKIDLEVAIRFGVLAVSFLIYSLFTILHMKKVEKNSKAGEEYEDLFESDVTVSNKVKTWPIALCFYALLILLVLGYVNWSNFGITTFSNFHNWLTNLSISTSEKSYTIISYILGTYATAFGSWDPYVIVALFGILLLIIALGNRIKMDDFIDNAIEGMKKVIKPLIIYSFVNLVFIFVYYSPFTTTISRWLLGLTSDGSFNPFIPALSAGITSIFNLDFGYTAYSLGKVLTSFTGHLNIIYVIYVTITGLMAFIAPTSATLMLGLSYTDLPYKKWIKHIWKFFFIMLVLLLILFSVMTYM